MQPLARLPRDMTSSRQQCDRWTRWLAIAVVLCASSAAPARAQPPAAPAADGYVANGPVHAIAQAGGRTYIGGDFTRVGRRAGAGARLSSSGARQGFPEVAGGDVRAVVSDGAGGWYIGGTFTYVGGERHVTLAHVESDGSVDHGFNPAASMFDDTPAEVDALAYSTSAPDAGTLYVGGRFDRIGPGGGEVHANVAALQGTDGAPVRSFNPSAACNKTPGCSPAVRALALAHPILTVSGTLQPVPVVVVGGDFTRFGPGDAPFEIYGLTAVWGAGALDKDGGPTPGTVLDDAGTASTPAQWKPLSSPGTVRALGLPADLTTETAFPVYAGGNLATSPPGNLLAAYMLRVDPASHAVTTSSLRFSKWNPAPDAAVRALAPTASAVYFGGDFTSVGPSAQRLGQIPPIPQATWSTPTVGTTATATAFGGGVGAPVRALAVSSDGSAVFAGGDFTEGVAAFDTSGAPLAGWTPPTPDAPVESLATAPGALYAGGRFRSLESQPRGGLAAFDSTGALLGWAPSVTSDSGHPSPAVRALAASDSTVYVGGRFDALSGAPRANLAAIDAASGAPLDFHPNPSRTVGSPAVNALSLLDATLYVGGAFDRVGDKDRDNLAAVDAGSGSPSDWSPDTNGNVYTVLPACGVVYAGGGFTEAGHQPRNGLAALDPVTGAATPWDPSPNGSVFALARLGSTVYAGGDFGTVRGEIRQKLAGLRVADGVATAFDPASDGPVHALAVSDSLLYVGGRFDSVGGGARLNLAGVDPATGVAAGWNPGPAATVRALVLGDDTIYAGGDFGSVGATAQSQIAAFRPGAGAPLPPMSCAEPPPASSLGLNAPSYPAGGAPRSTGRRPAAPAVATGLTVRPATLRSDRTPLVVRFRLSRAARIRLRFERRVAARCPRRRARRPGTLCTRYQRFADVRGGAHRGVNRLTFRHQQVARRQLVSGRYRVTLTVLPATRGVPGRVASFRVVR
jgi:trimeric autotransporter adhesin